MKTSIKSISELMDRISMAQSFGKMIINDTATENDSTMYHVIMNEIREYVKFKKIKCNLI